MKSYISTTLAPGAALAVLALGLLAYGAAQAQTPPVAGLKLWLKADAITGLNAGDPVSTWPDSSGNGYAATQATPANQPQFHTNVLNGLPAVWFADPLGQNPGDPTAIDHLTSPLPLNPNSNSVTAIILFRSDITGQRDHLIQPLGAGTTWLYTETNSYAGGPTNCVLWAYASQQGLASAVPYFRGTWAVASVVQNAEAKTVALYRDGVLEGATDIGTLATPSSAGWLFGANKNKNGQGLNGYIAEVLIYEAALDEATRRAAEEYLAAKYGVSLRQNLLTDTFNTADTFDLEADLTARQTGDLAPLTNTPAFYSQWQSLTDYAQITDNTLKLLRLDDTDFAPDKRILVTPNQNFRSFEVNGSFRLTANITTTSVDPGKDSWAAITIGGNQLIGPVPANGFAVLVRPGGIWQAFDGPIALGSGATAGTTNYRVCFEVVNNKAKVFINGVPLAGDYEHPIANLGVANYITLSTHAAQDAVPVVSTFDNLVMSVLPEPVLPATVILADNYNTGDTSDLNSDLVSRQSGTLAPTGYQWAANNGATVAIEGNGVKITNPDNVLSVGVFCPNMDFLAYERSQSFRVRFKASPTMTGTADCWVGLKIRDAALTTVATGVGFSFLVTPTGGWQAFQGTTFLTNGAVAMAPTYEFDVEVRTNALRLKINGTQVLTHTMPGGTQNYVSLMSFASTVLGGPTGVSATFDDFEFAALGAAISLPPPQLVNMARAGDTASFQFQSVNGVVYIAERKDDVANPVWLFLRNVLGNGGVVTVTDTNAVSTERYYRLRVPWVAGSSGIGVSTGGRARL